MKSTLLAGAAAAALMLSNPAAAADPGRMPTKAPPIAVPAPVFSWTGFYLGGHLGYLWGHTVIEEQEIVAALGPTNGIIGGVLGGANWQIGSLVFGGEADIGWTDAHGSNLGVFDELFQYQIHWTSHVRGRLGYDFKGTLLYAAGGLAITHATVHMVELLMVCGGTYTGGTIGGGVEHAFSRQISGRIEYLYDNFGHKTYSMNDDVYRVGVTGQTVRGAVTFKFGL